ncbi:MAG: hypothetical protein O2902_03690 [Actinobacteria bacterium]|nr:hypothetical protein [Actinomycetota bacterium]
MRKLLSVIVALGLLAGCSSNVPAPSNSLAETAPDIATAVTELYEQVNAAFAEGFAQGIDFVIANNYPGAFDPAALQSCALAKQLYLNEDVNIGLPQVETLELVPNWVGSQSAAADWLLAGKSIDGDVYKFDLEIDLEILSSEVVAVNGLVFLLYGWCDDPAN